ncbi:SnoaL-like polyketide cyclase, partial [Nodularia sphaerocarpa CS-585A2]|nr:SnoaL-like polyketide cyclase [Nodularia sphaerocarpa CS-585A2]
EDLKILSLEHYYDNTKFLEKLTARGQQQTGQQKQKQPNFWSFFQQLWNWQEKPRTGEAKTSACPFSAFMR